MKNRRNYLSLRATATAFINKAIDTVASRQEHPVPSQNAPVLVVLENFKPEPVSLDLLQSLHDAGFDNPMLYGGALRDDYFRNHLGIDVPTNDYDIKSDIDVKRIIGKATTFEEATLRLTHYVEQNFHGCTIEKSALNMGSNGSFCAGGITFAYNGLKIELQFRKATAGLALEKRMWADEPLSMIAMDKSGTVMADENFEAHAKGRIFHPYELTSIPERSALRYERLSLKIPDLKLVQDPTPLVQNIVQPSTPQNLSPLKARIKRTLQTIRC